MRHHSDHVLQRQQRGAFNLRVDVLPLGAGSQQFHQGDVVPSGKHGTGRVKAEGHLLILASSVLRMFSAEMINSPPITPPPNHSNVASIAAAESDLKMFKNQISF